MFHGSKSKLAHSENLIKSVKVGQNKIILGASWIKLTMQIATFTQFVMPSSLTNCQKC